MQINQYLEHTKLSPIFDSNDCEQLVNEAMEFNFIGVCVPPYWVKKAKRDLGKSNVKLVTVVGFPLGYQRSEVKMREIDIALKDGADEIDVVMNLSAFKTGVMMWVKGELAQFAKACHEANALLKVIIETAYLSEEEIIRAGKISADAGADFVKTSTGFAPAGAKVTHIQLMRQHLPANVGIKASGGIKNLAQALSMIEAGADRIGTSSAVQIFKESQIRENSCN
ncbi:deoxyribose-phosphate aldolase [Thermoflexibacter ruber]|uniref:Deoxyribose-phosphate aldolase n=1 Tax=Thermoflexibacter ruber TaxID=1003 RepID=A0A1I2HZM7_9BACT|nr:deoxyribose-phosphate aldolase [Thermoflexibacter ruber]SFF34820.1 deoxyribose-phosphate aldolase [Thermoflexibacter ruber]